MPQVNILFYGPARDLVGQATIKLTIGDNETTGALAGRLAEKFPNLGAALGVRLAVNRAYVPLNHVLKDDDVVAIIPPVSGGASLPRAVIQKELIQLEPILAELHRLDAGGTAIFIGTVRAELEGCRPLLALEYEAFDAMALEQMQEIRRRGLEKFGALDAAIVHRVGRVALGEASIAVIVVSAHREQAFEACRWMVDAVKTDAPIWKKNMWADGSQDWSSPSNSGAAEQPA